MAVVGRMAAALLLVLLTSWFLVPASGGGRGGPQRRDADATAPQKGAAGRWHGRGGGRGAGGRRGLFILGKPRKVMKAEGGEVRLVVGRQWKGERSPMHIAFIHMQPTSLFIPQYVDAHLILFLRTGKVKVGWIHKNEMVERDLRTGDVVVIPAGSAFYVVNRDASQSSNLICSIDATQGAGYSLFESFFIGGGSNPASVLAGFDADTLAAAFNVSSDQLGEVMTRQTGGPIVCLGGESPSAGYQSSGRHSENEKGFDEDEDEDDEKDDNGWRWQKLIDAVLGWSVDGGEKGARKALVVDSSQAYNLYANERSYENSYGWSTSINEHDYSPLKHSGVGVYMVNLTAGSMMAPHFNPMATEYGVVLSGSGRIQIVFPNGSSAMDAKVSEGDVFWVPRYFPFCQIASEGAPMVFFGFTTSSSRNRPQFLAGASSVLRSMGGPELAAAFGVREDALRRLVTAQRESVILPIRRRHEDRKEEEPKEGEEEEEEEEKKKRKKAKVTEELLMAKRVFFAEELLMDKRVFFG